MLLLLVLALFFSASVRDLASGQDDNDSATSGFGNHRQHQHLVHATRATKSPDSGLLKIRTSRESYGSDVPRSADAILSDRLQDFKSDILPTGRTGRSVDPNVTSVQRPTRVQLVDPNDVLFGISKDFAVKLIWVLEELLAADVITSQCMSSLLATYSGILRDDVWALMFLDSTGKVPTGLLEGTTTSLGSYDECLFIKTPIDVPGGTTVVGRYCMLRWNITDASEFRRVSEDPAQQYVRSIQLGICIPSQCTGDHLAAVAAEMLQAQYSSVGVSSCRSRQDRVMNKAHVAIICLVSLWCTVIVLATLIHIYWTHAKRDSRKARGTPERINCEPLLEKVILGLSAITSTKGLFEPERCSSPRRIIHGIRVVAVLWIFLGQTYELQTFQALSSPDVYYSWRNCPLYSLVVNWSLGFTVLFLVGGVIGSSAILEKSTSGIGSLTLTAVVLLRRYIALTFPAILVVGIFILLPLLLEGPFANDILPKLTSPCYQEWWTVLLHFNNWNGLQDICYRPLWYIACQFQLCAIICVPIIILVRRPNIGVVAMAVLCSASLVGVSVQASLYGYDPFPTLLPGYDTRDASRTLSSVLFLPFLHTPAIIVGAVAGYWALKDNNKSRSTTSYFFYWTAAIVSLVAALFSPYIWDHWIPSAPSAMFLVGVRFLLACSLGWLVFDCLRNRSSLLSRVLSCRCFVPLSRLYVPAYLVSAMVTMSPSLTARDLIYASHSVIVKSSRAAPK
ncbi:nose resistant to fluoxetine protein 6-like isoform X2 [Ornithodoros turicata]|uniref:nose resistant to fluoxetine protein 6-like isoform X2 n=1 Tax=Ornithodoros turicata TaxID=34597 RepID=UPI00313937E8